MAAYVQNLTAAAMKLNFESMQNINDKEIFYSIFDTISTEYARMASLGLAGYTLTSGLQASLEAKCLRMSDALRVEILKSFFVVLLIEYASVVTSGLAYTITVSSTVALQTFRDHLLQSVENFCSSENRIMLGTFIDQLQAEHVLLEAAV
jgi:hypothetical protein